MRKKTLNGKLECSVCGYPNVKEFGGFFYKETYKGIVFVMCRLCEKMLEYKDVR